MKKIFKNSFIALAAVFAFTACTEEVDYTPAEPSKVDNTQFYFNREQATSAVLDLTETQYKVYIERVNAETEETINLIANVDEDIFTVPQSVTFAAGETTAEIVVSINEKMEPFVEYDIEISIPEEFINPYKQDNNSILTVQLLKEDYVPYAKAIYTWNFLGIQYYQDIQYSEILGAYRMVAPWSTPASAYVAAGYGAEQGEDVVFFINEETGAITLQKTALLSGLIHPSYGSVTANFEIGAVQEGVLLFQYKWTVSAGSFGSYVDQVQIVELY